MTLELVILRSMCYFVHTKDMFCRKVINLSAQAVLSTGVQQRKGAMTLQPGWRIAILALSPSHASLVCS
jgi:hypothetical protein